MHSNVQKLHQASRSFGIRSRLFIGFGAIAVIMFIAIGVVLLKTTTAKTFAYNVVETHLPAYEAILDLNKQIYHLTASLQGVALTNDAAYKAELTADWNNIEHLMNQTDNLSKYWDNGDLESWQQVKFLLSELKAEQLKIENSANPQDNAQAFKTAIIPRINKILDIIDGRMDANGQRIGGMQDSLYKILHEGTHEIIDNMNIIQIVEFISLIICLTAAVVISLITAKKILKPLNSAMDITKKIAAGDLTQRVDVETQDEMGKLGQDLNAMTEGLAVITQKITEASHNMVTTLEEVKHSVDMQSTGTSEQASAINEITSSLEEIEKSSLQTMEKAKTLGSLAEKTHEKGQLGLQSVEDSISGMKFVRDKVQMIAQTILELSNQTQQVGEITAVVNRLAQQSTMLALNASIEAAKAGEAGKGFAVVAAEVKNLAEQSEQSTSQVQKILEDIRHATEKAVMATEEGTKGVEHGTSLVEQTGGIVHSLNEAIHETMIASQHIEAAVRQEGVGIEQITAGMSEINQVTSSFVASVRETTEAISHLADIARRLKENVEIYKI